MASSDLPDHFEPHAGRVREDHEPIEFSVPIEIADEMRDSPAGGTLGRSVIVKELRLACEAFNASMAALHDHENVIPHR